MSDHKITICVGADFLSYETKMIIDSDLLQSEERYRVILDCQIDKERSKDYMPFWTTSLDLEEAKKLRDMLNNTILYFEKIPT